MSQKETLNIDKHKKENAFIKEHKPVAGFKCFKIGHTCPHTPIIKERQVFVGMPFGESLKDSFEYGIKPALDSADFTYYKADEECTNIDIMCKICKAIQESRFVIINISSLNPNVMFELGLAYGLGKEVFIIKDKTSEIASDIKGLEYTEYSYAGDLQKKLKEKLNTFKRNLSSLHRPANPVRTGAEYTRYFKVISTGNGLVKVVNGADEEAGIAGYFTAGHNNIPCAVTEVSVSGVGVVYIRIYHDTEYKYQFGFAATIPSVAQEIYIVLASVDANGIPAQQWTDGAIIDLNGK